jgi:hypothetical protein
MNDCPTPISDEVLTAYWAADVDQETLFQVEEHIFSCDSCAEALARISAVAESIRSLLPPVLKREQLEGLRGRGLRIVENPIMPGERAPCVFAREVDVLLHVLKGVELHPATEVTVSVLDEESGSRLLDLPSATFEAGSGEVLIACQRHFVAFPPNIIFEIRAQEPMGAERVTRYYVPHGFEP